MRVVLRRAVSDAQRAIRQLEQREGVGATVQKEQQLVVLRALHDQLATLFTRIGHTISANRQAAAAQAIRTMVQYSEVLHEAGLSDRAIKVFTDGEIARASAAIDSVINRVLNGRLPLSQQVYRTRVLTSGQVDRVIDSAIARGVSWAQLAKDVRSLIDPNVRGGVSYAAQRLGRTEVATAYHATAINYGQSNPFVIAMKWNLSGSHPAADVCDDYAAGGDYPSEEQGLYKPESVPGLPHPQCLCNVTPQTESLASFASAMANGDYDNFLGS